jgi:hypothetical protein
MNPFKSAGGKLSSLVIVGKCLFAIPPHPPYPLPMIHENLSQAIQTLSARMIAIRDSL